MLGSVWTSRPFRLPENLDPIDGNASGNPCYWGEHFRKWLRVYHQWMISDNFETKTVTRRYAVDELASIVHPWISSYAWITWATCSQLKSLISYANNQNRNLPVFNTWRQCLYLLDMLENQVQVTFTNAPSWKNSSTTPNFHCSKTQSS